MIETYLLYGVDILCFIYYVKLLGPLKKKL